MPQILILKTGKRVNVGAQLHMVLCAYKILWPPETTLKLGKKTIKLEEFDPWPPAEQQTLIESAPVVEKKPEPKDLG